MLRGTIRATTPAARDLLVGEVDRLSIAVAATHRLQAAVIMGRAARHRS